MNVDTGETYASKAAALAAGVPPERLVTVKGPKKAVKKVVKAVCKLSKNQAKRKRQKAAGKR